MPAQKTRAAVFIGPRKPFELWEIKIPSLAPGGVLIEMEMAAVCGSDVRMWHSPRSTGPEILGHENVGRVAALNGAVVDARGRPVREGDRVVFRPAPCGRCLACLHGLPCRVNGRIGRSAPADLMGGFAQHLCLTTPPWILRLPEDMSAERALLAVVGNHLAILGLDRIGGVQPGDTVVVLGAGPVGMGAVVQARVGGAGKVVLVGAPAGRLALGRDVGADDTVGLDEHPSPAARVQRVLELTGATGADLVIECSGADTAVQEGLEMVRLGGRLLVLGQYQDNGPQLINPSLIVQKMARIEGVQNSVTPFTYIARSVEVMRRAPQPVERLITHRFPLAEVNEAFHAHASQDAMIPVLLPNG